MSTEITMNRKARTFFSDEPILHVPSKTIFLAGPTSRDNDYDKSWRKEMVELINAAGFDGTICIPEFRDKRPFTVNDWGTQVKWEWTLLDAASCILFWVPRSMPETPGLTTNLEFGTYLQKKPCQVILSYPEEAAAMEWMTLKYKEVTAREPSHNMVDAVAEAIEIANKFGRK